MHSQFLIFTHPVFIKEKTMKGRNKGEEFLGLELATRYTTNPNNERVHLHKNNSSFIIGWSQNSKGKKKQEYGLIYSYLLCME